MQLSIAENCFDFGCILKQAAVTSVLPGTDFLG